MTNYKNNCNQANQPIKCSCKDLLEEVCAADLFALDLRLYLDTHPYDSKALSLYCEAVKEYKVIKEAYECECCGTLSPYSAGKDGSWDWKCSPWPWERM